jgi:uncharacterized protein YoaH (UPF0181 family)
MSIYALMATASNNGGAIATIAGHQVSCNVRVQKRGDKRTPAFYFRLDGVRKPFRQIVAELN